MNLKELAPGFSLGRKGVESSMMTVMSQLKIRSLLSLTELRTALNPFRDPHSEFRIRNIRNPKLNRLPPAADPFDCD
jgi:hypothetical protein